jgi:hypothetical protein
VTPEPEPESVDAKELAKKIIESGKASDTMEESFLRAVALLTELEQARIKMDLRAAFKSAFVKSEWMSQVRIFIPKKPVIVTPRPRSDLPEIIVSDRQLRDITKDAVAALCRANLDNPFLFVRSGSVCHVVRDEIGRPSVEDASDSWIRGTMSRTADWTRVNEYNQFKGTFPSPEVVRDVLSLDNPPFPPLMSVTEVPTLRADGTILDRPGYDPVSSVFYSPASTLTTYPLPKTPSREQVKEARDLINEAIGEFPYANRASRANVFGLLLTPVLRPALYGCTPLAVVDAPQAGTGKSLLIDVLSIITTGRPAAMVPFPYQEDEMKKQIGASLTAGRQLIAFDNLEGKLKSPALALALTAKEFESRILGFSKNMTVPNMATWIVTGNNIVPAGDMPRRCYQIRLDAKESKPYTGRSFKHPDLLRWVTENRSQLLHALLLIARYWFASGSPVYDLGPVIGSFEDWHRKVGGIVTHAGIPGFLSNYATFIEQEDESPAQWEDFLARIMELWVDIAEPDASKYFSIAEIVDRLRAAESSIRDQAPAEIADCLERKVNHRIAVGRLFSSRRDRRFGNGKEQLHLDREVQATDHKGSFRWRVVRTTS